MNYTSSEKYYIYKSNILIIITRERRAKLANKSKRKDKKKKEREREIFRLDFTSMDRIG